MPAIAAPPVEVQARPISRSAETGKLDHLDVEHHHLFPAESVGEVDDLRIALGHLLDLCEIRIGQLVALDDDVRADHRSVRLRDRRQKAATSRAWRLVSPGTMLIFTR
jgi:hypothetical protein